LSTLFDSLQRGRRREREVHHPDRTAEADAVLATLGYRKKKPNSYARPLLAAMVGIGLAIAIAWLLWPRT
jgi:hypothetical protein